MTNLVSPHGGLSEPVCRMVSADEAEAFAAGAAGLTVLPLSTADLSTVYRVADGTLSPLVGPMNEDVFNRVLDEKVIDELASSKRLATKLVSASNNFTWYRLVRP